MSLLERINWLNPLVLTVIFVLLVAGFKLIHPLFFWPVDGVRVLGAIDHVEKKRLQFVLADTLAPGFLASDMNEVKKGVETLPWVAEAKVMRVWPEQVEIAVVEKKPIANWLQNGLLDSNLVAFFPVKRPDYSDLPKLAGPGGTEKEVWAFYLKLRKRLEVSGLSVDVVSLARHGAWSVHIKEGPWLLLGKEQTHERLERIHTVLSSLQGRWEEARLVDLRYPNGFSVEWLQ